MQDNQVLFEIKDLCKSFGDNLVLDHISTEIRKGEVVVIEESFGIRVTEIIK